VGTFGSPQVTAAVTWNPQLSVMKAQPGAKAVFTSADIPGEILDLLVVDTATLKANPKLGKALAGIWYETVALMKRQDAQGKAARARWPSWPVPRPKPSTTSSPPTFTTSPRPPWPPPPIRRWLPP
jgi:NitT/TauT family transport system substrate-binding protein